jgi:hypothetical protein
MPPGVSSTTAPVGHGVHSASGSIYGKARKGCGVASSTKIGGGEPTVNQPVDMKLPGNSGRPNSYI